MRTETIVRNLYKFDELSDKAKEKARDRYRESGIHDEWWDSVYEDAEEIAKLLGIEIRQLPIKTLGGKIRYEPAIYFRGFSSQGNGACFEGTYRYRKGSVAAIKDYAPQDETLHRIAKTLQEEQKKSWYRLSAKITHRGNYCHSYSMDIEVDSDHPRDFDAEPIRKCMRDFADWIYERLEEEYDYLNSDEAVDESITANDYEFTKSGELA
jgi:hypothetical protein